MDLVTAGQHALATARDLWARRIVDPPRSTWRDPAWAASRQDIDAMIRGERGLGWPRCSLTVEAYRHDGDYEWCGAGAATCWRSAGLDGELAAIYWSSTYRLSRYGHRGIAFGTPRELRVRRRLSGEGRAMFKLALAKRGKRLVATTPIEDVIAWAQPGDVLTIDSVGTWRYGHHICLLEEIDPVRRVALTFEANATGVGPDGSTYQGFVRGERPIEQWRRLYRPAESDLTGPTWRLGAERPS